MKQRILIIEDNEQNLYLLKFLLEKHGLEVIEAYDGPQGIEAARESQPDLVLLDIQLPGMDGYEVARALRRDVLPAEVPIVAVTSYAMPGDREKAEAAGCIGYLEKPITPEKFVRDISVFLPVEENVRGNS